MDPATDSGSTSVGDSAADPASDLHVDGATQRRAQASLVRDDLD